jgi:hypothetical protein
MRIYSRIKGKIDLIFSYLNQRGILSNAKQRRWITAIKALDRKELVVLETGRIRNPKWVLTDGNSTYFLTGLSVVKKLISIDNDSENFTGYSGSEAYCRHYLNADQLSKIVFVNGDSRTSIANLPEDTSIDVALLDSANDPDLILDELKAVMPFLSKESSVIIIDDVSNPGKKGNMAIPYLENKGYVKHLISAAPSDCAYFFIT